MEIDSIAKVRQCTFSKVWSFSPAWQTKLSLNRVRNDASHLLLPLVPSNAEGKEDQHVCGGVGA